MGEERRETDEGRSRRMKEEGRVARDEGREAAVKERRTRDGGRG